MAEVLIDSDAEVGAGGLSGGAYPVDDAGNPVGIAPTEWTTDGE